MSLTARLAPLADLVLPAECVGCARPGAALCSGCVPSGPPRRVDAVPGLIAAGEYDGGLRAALIAYKERGRIELARPLGLALAGSVRLAVAGRPVVLVPVPSSRRAVRRRGGDHLLRLARVAGRAEGTPVRGPLRLVRRVSDSAGLDRTERAINLAGSMRSGPPPRDHAEALIVDDIVTTGTTVREAYRALSEAGWTVRAAAVVAWVPPHGARSGGAQPVGLTWA